MEEETQEKPQKPLKKRKVSLFKRRKKAEIRPFVKEKKEKRIKKVFKFLALVIAIIFGISVLLYGIRHLLIITIFSNSTTILTPQSSSTVGKEDVDQVLRKSGIDYKDLVISTSSATITFQTNNSQIFLSKEKSVEEQIKTVQAILRRLSLDGKRATVVDLRYNKPIVKF